jgi:hypothetical protein
MKVWGSVLLCALAACAAPARPARSPEVSPEARAMVDGLRVDREYRPAPQGNESYNAFFELPRGAYVAQGWAVACCAAWPSCCHRSARWRAHRD